METILSRLVPRPRHLKAAEGCFAWGEDLQILIEPHNPADAFAAQTLAAACVERRLAPPAIIESADFGEAASPRRILAGDPARNWPLHKAMQAAGIEMPVELDAQGYLLVVAPEHILIAANSAEGVYYGFQTLIQLLPRQGEGSIPALRIEDWPGMPQRGISIDLFSGEVYTLAMMEKTIERMAHYKLNFLVLYFEDAFEFPSHPDIGADRDRVTWVDAQTMVAVGRKHHLEICPCYDSPGHIGHTLRHPAYRHLVEGLGDGRLENVINVTDPETYPLMRDLYGDLCRAFPCRTHYVSGDEVLHIGSGKSRKVLDEVGNASLFLRHVKIVRDILFEHGKRMALAGDPFEPGFFKAFGLENYGIETLVKLPRDVIIGPWHYGRMSEFPFGQQLKDLGFDQYLWTSNQAFKRLFPNQIGAAANYEDFAPFGHDLEALGIVHSDWNLPGENTFSEYNWPSILTFSEWAWIRDGRSWRELLPIALETFYGPGVAPLADTIHFLSNANHYFHWADPGWGEPEFNLYFREISPEPLDQEKIDLLEQFRRDEVSARAAFESACQAAARNCDHLDYIAFALDQFRALGDIVEARHCMASDQPRDAERCKHLLEALLDILPDLHRRYAALWLRVNKPVGLAPNIDRMKKLEQSVSDALRI